jgi:hypothetical protein
MRTKLAAAVVVTAALTAVTAAPVPAAPTGRCFAKQITIKGHSAIASCGPATATVVYKGRRYRFKSGSCLKVAGSGGAIMLDLGTNVLGSDQMGLPHFSLTMLSSFAPVLASSGTLSINGNAKLSGRGVSGTFKGTNTIVKGGKISEAPFSGSWKCGTIYAF